MINAVHGLCHFFRLAEELRTENCLEGFNIQMTLNHTVDRYRDCPGFFGHNDHYRKSGIVSVKTWEKYFGKTYSMYDGTHFMEEEFVRSMLVPMICKVLENNKGNKNV